MRERRALRLRGDRALGVRRRAGAPSSSASSTSGCAATSARCSCRCSTSRSPTGTASPPGCACTPPPAARRWRWSSTATCTPATTSWSRTTCAATSTSGTSRSSSASSRSCGSATASRRRCRSTASTATCASPATAAASRTASGSAPDGQPGLNYLCPGYKAFFHHVDAPMKRMCELLREQRPPADIVAEYARPGLRPPPERAAPASCYRIWVTTRLAWPERRAERPRRGAHGDGAGGSQRASVRRWAPRTRAAPTAGRVRSRRLRGPATRAAGAGSSSR